MDCLEHVAGVASRGPSRERGERSRERGHDRRLDRVPGGLDRSWEAERYIPNKQETLIQCWFNVGPAS